MPAPAPYDVLFVDGSFIQSLPLPTPDDLADSQPLKNAGFSGKQVVRVRDEYVVKFGRDVDATEAHNMMFVARSTSIPVPKVYAIYQRQEESGTITYIVMQYIEGTTLNDMWTALTHDGKTNISRTLRGYFDQLRQLQGPDYFGNIDGGAPLDSIFRGTEGGSQFKTSFTTEEDLVEAVIRVYETDLGERMTERARYYRHVLPTALRGSGSPVFTHNDLQRKNIMIQPDGNVVVIDWESASWCPTYWEYATATFANGGWYDNWHDYLRLVLDEYNTEALWLSTLKLEMWS